MSSEDRAAAQEAQPPAASVDRKSRARTLRSRALHSPVAPVALAVLFGLLSIPIVAVRFAVTPDWALYPDNASLDWLPLGSGDALVLAACAVLAASAVGGACGGFFVRRHPVGATLVAIATAWPVAIAVLPFAAARLGIDLRLARACFFNCSANLTSENPGSGLVAYAQSLVVGAMLLVPLAVAAVLFLAAAIRRRRSVMSACWLVVAAYGALHVVAILLGGGIAFICLAVGVVTWTWLLHIPTRLAPEAHVLSPVPREEATTSGWRPGQMVGSCGIPKPGAERVAASESVPVRKAPPEQPIEVAADSEGSPLTPRNRGR